MIIVSHGWCREHIQERAGEMTIEFDRRGEVKTGYIHVWFFDRPGAARGLV